MPVTIGGGNTGAPAAGNANVVQVANSPGANFQVQKVMAERINSKLANTPMRGTGETFVAEAARYDLHPLLMPAIAGLESQFGTTGFATNGSHNPFGLGVTGAAGAGFRFGSWEAAIRKEAQTLGGSIYKGAGRTTIDQIGAGRNTPSDKRGSMGPPYAADDQWSSKVAQVMSDLAGASVTRTTKVIGVGSSLGTDLGDAADSAADLVTAPWKALLEILKFITNPAMWIRVASAIAGFIAMVVGVLILVKGSKSGRPFGFIIAGLGLAWVYAAIRNVKPLDEVKSLLGG